MGKGISVFVGMKYKLNENKEFIVMAKKLSFTSVFTSLHIPEANYEEAIKEFKELAKLCSNLNMNITADISPRPFNTLEQI